MRCPKCGYSSFDHNDNCPKCGKDITAQRTLLNLAPFEAQPENFIKAAMDGAVDPGGGLAEETADEITAPEMDEEAEIALDDAPIEIETPEIELAADDEEIEMEGLDMDEVELDLGEGDDDDIELEVDDEELDLVLDLDLDDDDENT